jgi:ABC-type antimicrobial peptide transport system permease subunit
MAYSVSQRTRELGIRISVGAKQHDVLKLILEQTLILAAIGIAGGLVTAVAVTRVAADLLYGISPADPATFALMSVLLLGVALVAGYFPARRATKIDPMIALSAE